MSFLPSRSLRWVLAVQVVGCGMVFAAADRDLSIYLLGLVALLPGSAVAAILTSVLSEAGAATAFRYFWEVTDIGYLPAVFVINVLLFRFVIRRIERTRRINSP